MSDIDGNALEASVDKYEMMDIPVSSKYDPYKN